MKSVGEYSKKEEKLFVDDEDRAWLKSLSETQREKVLYERHKALQAIEEKRQLLEMDRSAQPAAPQKTVPAVKFEDCAFVVSRELLTANAFKPFFSLFKSCFIRAKVNGEYRICKIIGISEREAYPLADGSKLNTTVALNIDTGEKIYKQFELTNVSSRGMLEEEFEAFLSAFEIQSADSIVSRYKKVVEEMNRNLTDEEITKTIANRLRDNPKKKNNTEKKIDLILKRDAAVAAKNKAGAFFYQQQIEQLEDSQKEKKRKREFEELEEVKKRLKN